MKFKEFIKDNKVYIICLVLYALVTIPAMLSHVPLFDEAHAWRLAQILNFSNFIEIIKLEGHPILWYLILSPFAKFNFLYPYPMIIINYLSCMMALFLVWSKAPFGKFLKVIITFSAMFMLYLPITLRSYSLGVLLLFLLCSLYKKQMQHFILYAVLIGLAINMNVMTAIGAMWFCCVYLYKLIINSDLSKRNKVFGVLILLFFFAAAIPLFFASNPTADLMRMMFCPKNVLIFFVNPLFYLLICFVAILVYLFIKVKNKTAKIFALYSNTLMLALFVFVYPGFYHHFIFFFIYLIVFMWLADDENIMRDNNFILAVLFGLFLLPPLHTKFELETVVHQKNIKNPKAVINFINKNEEFSNSKIYIHRRESYLIPYIKNNVKVYDICNLELILPLYDFTPPAKCDENIEMKIADSNKNVYIFSNLEYFGEKIFEIEDYSIIRIKKY